MINTLNVYGFASGIAAGNPDAGLGPLYLYYHPEIFKSLPFQVEWKDLLMATSDVRGAEVLPELTEILTLLAQDIAEEPAPFCVLGGDHSSGIGTWSGAAAKLESSQSLGLIWVDAHMDSHTPETSGSQNIHGMPLSHLLGYGIPELCHLQSPQPKIKPEHLCLVGIRSFEAGEAALLKRLNVKVISMEEVKTIGMDQALQEALAHVRAASHIGLSIDLDAFDPQDAPGTGCLEHNGIRSIEFLKAVQGFYKTPGFLGLEIAELNPLLDDHAKTAYLVRDLMGAVFHV